MIDTVKPAPSGHYSPLRYPGGKGKLARFVADLIRVNGLQDGHYVEPYAGGAAVAMELLLTGIVRRVTINDLNKPVHAFWDCVLNDHEALIDRIQSFPVDMATRDWAKKAVGDETSSKLDLGFATFFLNRTNRSGILNGGPIGGRDQSGPWKIDARYNKNDLVCRITRIARMRSRITLENRDAVELLKSQAPEWSSKTLVYLDPPYYDKGRDLYYNFYKHDDHANVAFATHNLRGVKWIVSYDDVEPIHALYKSDACLQYTIGYSARERGRGAEAMFFSPDLIVPAVRGSMIETRRWEGADPAVA
ncbi:DNA adenine methylase [Brevundimonas sp. TSRC1-1]|uniref:DNA adenine methylase n=1 Tax=Brevundimonas sp. TSRC1-1 TaxID=2804562 RepID=UPI003CEB5757